MLLGDGFARGLRGEYSERLGFYRRRRASLQRARRSIKLPQWLFIIHNDIERTRCTVRTVSLISVQILWPQTVRDNTVFFCTTLERLWVSANVRTRFARMNFADDEL